MRPHPTDYSDSGLALTLNKEVSIASSIVSNKGFIRQMTNGGTKLNATHVAVWGGMLSTGQLIGVGFLQMATDRLGRKVAMHLTWLTLCVVSCGILVRRLVIY